jgi:formylglycine-generating enzyme required for sulfatase activity
MKMNKKYFNIKTLLFSIVTVVICMIGLYFGYKSRSKTSIKELSKDSIAEINSRFKRDSLVSAFNDPVIYTDRPDTLSDSIVNPKDKSVMILIPSGVFIYGIDEKERNKILRDLKSANLDLYKFEFPRKKVHLDAFYIDKYEITNGQYKTFTELMKYKQPKSLTTSGLDRPQLPVTYIGWEDARNYLKWAGKILPNEEQWEKAARGTDGRIFPWGNDYDNQKYIGRASGYNKPANVGSKPDGRSPYGLMDMAGNVYEMTSSKWVDNFPVMRGGSFLNPGAQVRTMFRWSYPDTVNGSGWLGFRGIKEVKVIHQNKTSKGF